MNYSDSYFFTVKQTDTLERRLKVELKNSENHSQWQCPHFAPKAGTKLLQDYAEQATDEKHKSGLYIEPFIVCVTYESHVVLRIVDS